MAAEAVLAAGGAALGAFLNVLFDRMASERFVDFIRRHKLSDRLLQKLKTAMNSVRGVLDDAEEKEIRKPAVKQWLDDLKNAFFEADDLLDEIDYEATRVELDAESRSVIDDVCKFLRPRKSFKKGLKARLMEIQETIEDLVNQKEVLGLGEIMRGGESTERITTTSLIERSNIFGRERDQEAIMEVLLSDDVNRSKNLSIISIVGLGGIGKTTLAQLIYEDERVRNRFDARGWVSVSEKFDVLRITTDIAKKVAKIDCDKRTLDDIQVELKEKLTGKMFLLVLDDVWNESFTLWDILSKPLKSGGGGSKIIITTRNDGVAATVRSSSIFHLDVLASTECWQLFCKYAFDDQNSHDYPRLEEIGKEIVKRCDGLPLAVKVMGGVLGSKRHVKHWENVLRNDLWKFSKDEVLPVLQLSYRYLPSRLKQCFAYCSIFPKDYKFEKEQLILLWMAEGFLIEQEGNETMEEVGEEYFEELVSRSFFQHVDNSFVMHDLINDLARVVAGDFCFRFENQHSCRTLDKLRYFSCAALKEESSSRQLSTIFKPHLLRTFLPVYASKLEQPIQILGEMIPDLFLNQQRLRVLSLSRCWKVLKLPGSIIHLKHLRYLDLSRTSIRSLPECLCSFYNLQTLKLTWCVNLAKLPIKMERLINMRHLDIEGTNLQEMPPNMGKLIKLQTLTDFFVGKREGCGVRELGSLQHLGGTLRIHNLQNVVNVKDTLEAKIKCKNNLKELRLYWVGDTNDPHHEEAVLGGLEPHTEIEVISIKGYGGNSFPNWLESGAFPCLKELSVKNCPNLKGALPSHLPSLEKLKIEDCPQLQNCVPHAPNLSSLELIGDYRHGPNLYSLEFDDYYSDFFDPFESWTSNCLTITNIQESVVEKIGQLGSHFDQIIIAKYEPLQCFSLELFPKLGSLGIKECSHFESFCSPTQEFVSFEFLTQLILEGCPKLKFLPERMHSLLPALLMLKIVRCPEIETFPRDGLPLKLQSLGISNCNKLIAGRMNWDLQKLNSLTYFRIRNYEAEEMESFPEVTLLPSVLTSLNLCNLPYLKSLPEEGLPPNLITLELLHLQNLRSVEGLRHLTSLESLRIWVCPHLKTLPEESLPSSLSELDIICCPLLEKRYGRRKGEHWAKISRIPNIHIMKRSRLCGLID